MTNSPRITVVTPSFNQGRYLRQCIDSVLEQGYSNLQYIIIDGGSTDESVGIIESYGESIDYWVSEGDRGQSNGINKGLKRADGDLVAWLNSDDIYLPNTFDTVARAYHENLAASFYYGNGYRGDESGEPTSRFFENGTAIFDRDALAYGLNYILQPSVFMSRQMLIQIGYIDEDLHFGMDTDLWFRLSGIAPPQALAECLSISREYEDTKTSTGGFGRAEELRRISRDHSGLELTPGSLLYYLHTMSGFMESEPSIYTGTYRSFVTKFWQASAILLHKFGVGPDGIPYASIEDQSSQGQVGVADFERDIEEKLRALRADFPEFVELSARLDDVSQQLANSSGHASRLEEERNTQNERIGQLEAELVVSNQDRQARLDKLLEADAMLRERDEQIAQVEGRAASLQADLLDARTKSEAYEMEIERFENSLLGRVHQRLARK